MGKDTTAFKLRFEDYKNGKPVSEIYDAGLPKYSNGTPEAVDDATLDFIINHEGYQDHLGHDLDNSLLFIGSGLAGLKYINQYKKTGKWSKEDNRNAVREVVLANRAGIRRTFGDAYDRLTAAQKGVLDDIAFNIGVGKLNSQYSPKFVAAVLAGNMEEAKRQMDWGNHLARGLINRNKDRQAWWDSMSLTPVEVPAYIARQQQQQLPPVVPELKPYLFPYETQQLIKPLSLFNPTIMSRPSSRRLPNDLLWSLVFDDEQKQDDGLLYAKNGKLPRYGGGKTVIGSNVNMNDDGTFTDDYTRDFEDIVITPKGPRVKAGQLYKYQEPWDDEKFLNAVTVGGLNNLSPAQWARRAYDVVTGNLTTESWLNGNAGIVPTKYAEEHPNAAMAANALFDFWTLGGPSLLKNASQVGKLNPVSYAKYEPQPIVETKPTTVLIQPKSYLIEDIPGYQLKTLMRGNPLEKQLSKSGTISTNSIQAQANKASEVEKAVINKVLQQEEFAGQKAIDYNRFRKAVHDELIEYDVVPDARYEDYGLERLGISTKPVYQDEPDMIDRYNDIITRIHDFELQHYVPRITRRSTEEEKAAARAWRQSEEGQQYHALQAEYDQFHREHPDFTTVNLLLNARLRIVGHSGDGAKLNTYTFSSDKIPAGNAKHYDNNTLGHSRTYTTETEPEVLHVMESQSDWGQHNVSAPYTGTSSYLNDPKQYREFIDGHKRLLKEFLQHPEKYMPGSVEELIKNIEHHESVLRSMIEGFSKNALAKYLHDNYTYRQIQENLKYAAQHGHTKMRYPTPETAAKIEGYRSVRRPFKNGVELDPREFADNQNTIIYDDFVYPEDIEVRNVYRPEHQTILKKYLDFPKQFKKLHKNTEVREVTDTKGNTWYEVDVPKDFLNKEWMYGMSIPTVVGAGLSLNANGKLPSYSNGKISIKPANRGKLTRLKARTGKSESELYNDGNPAHKKMVVFARSSRKWHKG